MSNHQSPRLRDAALATAFFLLLAGCAGLGNTVQSSVPSGPTTMQSAQTNTRVASSTNCPALSGGTGILIDGDFSQAIQPNGVAGFNQGQTFAPSWHVSKGAIKLISSTYWNVDGLCSVDLDGGAAGAIAHKSFATSVNAKYTVTFYLSGNGDGGPVVKTLKLSAANQSKKFTWDTSNGNDARHGKYAQNSWTFTAVKTTTTLKFASLDPPGGSYGPVVAGILVKKD